MKKIFIAVVFLIIVLYTKAQSIRKLQDPANQFIIDRAIDIDTAGGVIYFKVDSLKTNELFTTYYSFTGLGPLDSMPKVRIIRDSILADEDSPEPNLYHDVYLQYYNGILVEGSDFTINHDGENVWSSSGLIVEGLNLNTTPEINEVTALNYATAHISCESYDWDSSGNTPVGSLVLFPVENYDTSIANNYKLVWKFTIVGFNPYYNKNIYVNANNGAIITELNNTHSNGSFNHLYYGQKTDLDTRKKGGNLFISDNWYLHANDNFRNILTTDNNGYRGQRYDAQPWDWDYMSKSDGDDIWGNDNWSATAAHYCAQKTWDYYKLSTLNRNGMTGWGKHVRIVADYPLYYGEAAAYDTKFGNDHLLIGRKSNRYMATYDVLGHEFTHGVVQNSNPLPYYSISGAINESFSDIFGFMVERYIFGYVRNWTIAEDAITLRNMQFPNSYSCPSHFLQSPYWKNPLNRNDDEGGVHYNSGVMNRWFYLLSMGGSEVVSGQTRNVGSIGIDKAARIAYTTMINGKNFDINNNTNFNFVRANSLDAARKLYGICSNEYNQTCAAWRAVNVGVACATCNISNWYNNNNQSLITSTNERESSVISLNVFPNPALDKITIILEEANNDLNYDGYQLTILDVNGKKLINKKVKSISNVDLDIATFASGVYFVNVTTDSWTKITKFIKN
jgi:Zn-dependent metalloprotease